MRKKLDWGKRIGEEKLELATIELEIASKEFYCIVRKRNWAVYWWWWFWFVFLLFAFRRVEKGESKSNCRSKALEE